MSRTIYGDDSKVCGTAKGGKQSKREGIEGRKKRR